MQTLLTNDLNDCQWLSEVHLPAGHPEFKAFELHGNEDAPDKVILYDHPDPTIFSEPVATYIQDKLTGVLKAAKH